MNNSSPFYLALCVLFLSCGESQLNEAPESKGAAVTIDSGSRVKGPSQPSKTLDTINALRIYVDRTGTISANGQVVTLTTLESKMQTLKSKDGVVHYSRDNASGDPPQQAMQVIQLVTKYELPIKLYTDDTFTEPVRMN